MRPPFANVECARIDRITRPTVGLRVFGERGFSFEKAAMR
jgi:hypothetical protein